MTAATIVLRAAGAIWCMALGVFLIALLSGCGAPIAQGCRSVYYYDPTFPRPYYALRECPGAPPVLVCDSDVKLPTATCK
jgi:hypothetical protein